MVYEEDRIKIENLPEDRRRGEWVELEFCKLMHNHKCFTHRFQKGYSKAAVMESNGEYILLPDVWVVWKSSLLAEVKWKYPNRYDSYGLEQYRIDSLKKIATMTEVPVFYVILDSEDSVWYWEDFANLLKRPYKTFPGKSYVGGEVKSGVPIVYFQKDWFLTIEKDGKLNFPSSFV